MKIKFDVLSLIIFSKHPKGLVSPFDRLFIHPCGDVRVYHTTIFNKFISYFSGVFLIWQDMYGLSLVTYTKRKQARMNKRINMLYNRWPVHICFEMHWHMLGNSKPLWKKQRILWSHSCCWYVWYWNWTSSRLCQPLHYFISTSSIDIFIRVYITSMKCNEPVSVGSRHTTIQLRWRTICNLGENFQNNLEPKVIWCSTWDSTDTDIYDC